MTTAAIVGGSGYAGLELIRLLTGHPGVELELITSRAEAGERVDSLFPNLRGAIDLTFSTPELEAIAEHDVVFMATPSGTAMTLVPSLLERGCRVLDLSADFRLDDSATYAHWYGAAHACPELLSVAAYGLPEVHRDAIAVAQLVAVPGCYPTAVQLGFLPLLESGLAVTERLVADAKSGASGAGVSPKRHTMLTEAAENLHAYGASGHRHLPEIRQGLSAAAGTAVGLVFVPHLVPMVRGLHASLYAPLLDGGVDLQALYAERYAAEPFVDVMPAGSHPETRSVRGANVCRLAVHQPAESDVAVILSVEDNLVKGAAGQAVQSMNVMLGLAETTGLLIVPTLP